MKFEVGVGFESRGPVAGAFEFVSKYRRLENSIFVLP